VRAAVLNEAKQVTTKLAKDVSGEIEGGIGVVKGDSKY
jgi:hypothetical protein